MLHYILMYLFVLIATVLIMIIIINMCKGKSLTHVFSEIKYELIYNVLGSKALLEDVLYKRRNKIDLPKRSRQIAVVTGGARGIGLEIVKMLMKCDMLVVVGCRNVLVGEKLRESIRNEGITSGGVDFFELDVGSIKSVKKFANEIHRLYPRIHLLVNNAGIMFGPYAETDENFESQFAVNYLGHFLLTHILLPNLKAAGAAAEIPARVVNVSSCAHLVGEIHLDDINMRKQYISSAAYAQSKLAQVLFTKYMARKCEEHNLPVLTFSVHPGIVNTDLFNGTPIKTLMPWLPHLIFKTPVEGAISVVYACLSPYLESNREGAYISNCRISKVNPLADSQELQQKLYDLSKSMLDVDEYTIS